MSWWRTKRCVAEAIEIQDLKLLPRWRRGAVDAGALAREGSWGYTPCGASLKALEGQK